MCLPGKQKVLSDTYLNALSVTLLQDGLDHLIIDTGVELVFQCGLGRGVVSTLCALPGLMG